MEALKALGLDPTLVAQMVNFIVLLLLLRWVAWKPLIQILESRRQAIAKALTDAEDQREEAIRIKEQYTAEMRQAKEEAQAVLDRAERLAAERTREILQEARQQGERLKEAAIQEINLEKDKALAALRDEVADLAILVAEKVIRENLNDRVQRDLVKEFVKEVGGLQ